MTEANRTPETLEVRGYKTVATLVIGPQTYLVMENSALDIRLDPVVPADQALYFHKQTKFLPPEATVRFDGIDPNKLTIGQLGTNAPAVTWTERVSGTEEVTFKISGTDAKKGTSIQFDIFEPELRDLFIRDGSRNPAANFFRIDTAGGSELVGIAVKKNFPAMFLLTPGKDGMNHSPAEGLLTFLSQIHDKLMEKPTGLQWRVSERIYSALIEDELVFKSLATTASQKRLQDIQKRIYMIQAAILAREAEDKDGDQDAALLAHVPFLNDPVPGKPNPQKGSALSRLFATQVPLPVAPKKQVVLDGNVWRNLLAKADKNLIDTPQARLRAGSSPLFQAPVTRSAVQPTIHIIAPRPAPQPSSQPVQPVERIITPTPSPEQSIPVNEKQDAIKHSADIDLGIIEIFGLFKDVDLENLNGISLIKLQNQLEKLNQTTERYFRARPKRAPMPQAPTEVTVAAVPTAIDLGEIDAKLIFEFLDKNKLTNAREKIMKAFGAFESLVAPIYPNTNGRGERKLSVVTNNTSLLDSLPDVRDQLLPAINAILAKAGRKDEDVYVAEFAQHILSLQILYALQLQYRALRSKGEAGEIDSWISFTKNTINRLRSQPVN